MTMLWRSRLKLRGLFGALVAVAVASLSGPVAAQPPSNDDIALATTIGALPFSDAISTVEATTAEDDPSCAGNGSTVWYEFTPSENGRVRATTFGSDYDTTLSVYVGGPGALEQIVCNDDTNGVQSRVDFDAAAGTTYFIMVGACCGGAGGSLAFGMDVAPPPPVVPIVQIDSRGLFAKADGTVTVSGTASCEQPSVIQINLDITQVKGRLVARAAGSGGITCSGAASWSVTASGYTGVAFIAGAAKVQASGFAFTDPDFEFIGDFSANQSVKLHRAKS